jgi:hypothetical protein
MIVLILYFSCSSVTVRNLRALEGDGKPEVNEATINDFDVQETSEEYW